MADPPRGRGRGMALLEALKKAQKAEESSISIEDSSLVASHESSVAPSISTTSLGGRGRIAMMLKARQMPGAGGSHIVPASDVAPSAPPTMTKGAGRGIKLLQHLKTAQMAQSPASTSVAEQVGQVTQQMAKTSLVSAATGAATSKLTSSVAKNKYFKEIKDTPPVVMKGESGTPCDVTANFIYLKFQENQVFEYEVVYKPEQDYKHLRVKLLNEHSQYFKVKTFDGTTLYVPHMLPDEALNLVSTNPFDDSKVNITIIFRRTRRLSEMIHIYNVLFKQIMRDLDLVRFGRQHFNGRAAIQIPQYKLEVWPGYVTAVDEYEGGLMLTLDSTHRVLRTQSVLEYIKEVAQTEGANWKAVVSENLINASVMTTYNNKFFRVDKVDDKMTPQSTFEKNEGGKMVKISYVEYYKKNYGIEIMDWKQPMLISRESKRMSGTEERTEFLICLVPELCQLTGLTTSQRNNFRLMKDVATYTRITPNQRHAAFKKYISNVLSNETAKARLSGWGLSIAENTIDITARTLQPETLYFGHNVKVPGKPNADWNGEVTRRPVMQAVDLLSWALLYTQRDKQVTMDFADTLKRCSGPMGLNVAPPNLILLRDDRPESYINALSKCVTSSLQLVVLICPTARDDRYAAIKKKCCADNPIPSQVINSRTIMNQQKIRSVTQKILLQINCKLGGTLWHISIPFKSAMIVGIDSYHDARRKERSVCSFISSYNQSMTHWYSNAVFQSRSQEIVDLLKMCLMKALNHYVKVNNKLPDKIIIYRDGVGDGQLKLLQEYEVPQMKICITEFEMNYKPSLTYIVVQKRINTRIFMKTAQGYENPHPGTVVDHDITRRDWYDFLIASQKVNQGTVTPTHYVVVHDDSGMTPDQVQRLTYKMCHLYYNWPGTVRVPAPCQYAHKLAYLVGEVMHESPSEVLSDKLFFL